MGTDVSPGNVAAGVSRRWRIVITLATVAALFAPVVLDRDGLPLSTYPMYARQRSDTVSFVTARGVLTDGSVVRLSLDEIGQSDDPLIVAGELRRSVADGDALVRCELVAARVRDRSGIVAVEVVTERHDMLAFLDDASSIVEENVHARCTTELAS